MQKLVYESERRFSNSIKRLPPNTRVQSYEITEDQKASWSKVDQEFIKLMYEALRTKNDLSSARH